MTPELRAAYDRMSAESHASEPHLRESWFVLTFCRVAPFWLRALIFPMLALAVGGAYLRSGPLAVIPIGVTLLLAMIAEKLEAYRLDWINAEVGRYQVAWEVWHAEHLKRCDDFRRERGMDTMWDEAGKKRRDALYGNSPK